MGSMAQPLAAKRREPRLSFSYRSFPFLKGHTFAKPSRSLSSEQRSSRRMQRRGP